MKQTKTNTSQSATLTHCNWKRAKLSVVDSRIVPRFHGKVAQASMLVAACCVTVIIQMFFLAGADAKPLTPALCSPPALTTSATAIQDDQQTDRKSELGQRQRAVQQRWTQLESQFMTMAEKLKASQPERADRLIVALNTAKQNLIGKRMEEVATLLDAGQLTQADKTLSEVISELENLVRLLLNDDSNRMKKDDEINFLEQVKKDIKDLLKDQNQKTRETFKLSNREKVDQKLKAAVKEIDDLIGKQADLQKATEGSKGGLKAQDQAAENQFQIRKKTLEVARDLENFFGDPQTNPNPGEDGQPKPTESKPGESKPGENKPTQSKPNSDKPKTDPPDEAQPGENKPSQSKPTDSKPGESKPSEGKPSESKPGPGKPGESKPGESKPGESKPGEAKSGEAKPEENKPEDQSNTGKAAQQLKQAAESQQEAERQVSEGENKKSADSQKKAIEDLKQARNTLEQERRRLLQLPEEAIKRLSPEQRRLADRTKELSDKIAQAKLPSKDENSQDPNANKEQGDQKSGQKNVDQAKQAMDKAAEDLNKDESKQANQNQKKAEEELKTALAEVEERLNQLRQETREERLARLEARFREMLLRQQDLRGKTETLNDKFVSLEKRTVRDRISLVSLSTQQEELAELCQLAYDLLLEDGTSVVFPEIVVEVKEDMIQASTLLRDRQTGPLVQLLHREIESTLEELLDALKQSKNKGKGGGGGGGGGDQPLVKRSAELKMLRAAQLRVNRKTRQINQMDDQKMLPLDQINQELSKLSTRQSDISEMAERLIESGQQQGGDPNQPPEGEPEGEPEEAPKNDPPGNGEPGNN